jgi:hypothetical protein
MMLNKFTVEECQRPQILCKKCSIPFNKQEMRVTIKKIMMSTEYYHLPCFTPRFNQYIIEKNIIIKLNQENTKIFKDWLENWNSNFFPLDQIPPEKMKATLMLQDKSLTTSATRRRRMLIEIFLFLEINDISKVLPFVSKEFYHTTWEPELWKCLIKRDFLEISTESENWKHSYLKLYVSCCLECKEIPSEENFYRCPLIKRVLCNKCRKTDKYKLLCKSDIKSCFDIDAKCLGINFGQAFCNNQVVYKCYLLKAIEKFREKNKDAVLSKLYEELDENCKLVRDVKDINYCKMDKDYGLNFSKPNWDERNEDKNYRAIYSFIRSGRGKIYYNKIFSKNKGNKA